MSPQAAADWPRFLAPLRKALEPLRLPEGPFDPQAAWDHNYTMIVMTPARMAAGENPHPFGSLRLRRAPAAEGFTLQVEQRAAGRAGGLISVAKIQCAADRLATPQSWDLRTNIQDDSGKTVAETVVTETGKAGVGSIAINGQKPRSIPMSGPFTSNWSLMEAVQRLPFEGLKPLTFDLLEDLDLLKTGQSLALTDTVTVEIGGRPVRLHCLRQLGHAVHPTHYWLDDAHRLIAATGNLRAFLWNPAASAAKEG